MRLLTITSVHQHFVPWVVGKTPVNRGVKPFNTHAQSVVNKAIQIETRAAGNFIGALTQQYLHMKTS